MFVTKQPILVTEEFWSSGIDLCWDSKFSTYTTFNILNDKTLPSILMANLQMSEVNLSENFQSVQVQILLKQQKQIGKGALRLALGKSSKKTDILLRSG